MGSGYFNLIQNWALCVQVIQAKVEGNKHKNILIVLSFFFFLSKKRSTDTYRNNTILMWKRVRKKKVISNFM